MEYRVFIFLVGFVSSALSELNGDKQNSLNYQQNEAPSQRGFGQNVHGNKASQVEGKLAVPPINQGEPQRVKMPITTSGIPFAMPYSYGPFLPLQHLVGTPYPEAVNEYQPQTVPQPQKVNVAPESYNVLAAPSPYMHPSALPLSYGTPTTVAPNFGYANNVISPTQSSKFIQPTQQNTNDVSNQSEHSNNFHSPVTFTYPVPIPMPFPSYFPYPQMQYPR